jgi:cell division protein FtsQ
MTILQAIAASLGIALVAAIVFEVQDAREAGVTKLELEGSFDKVDPDALRDTLKPWLAGGVLASQMDVIKAQLEQLPWVARARVERAWPGVVRVRVWEYEPYARWNDALLSSDGHVFRVPADEIPMGLPELSGPEGRHADVRDAYEHLRSELSQASFAPAALSLSERGDWLSRTADGVELRFGRSELDEQIDFIKGPVSQALTEKRSEVQYVDLHYSNGFAVGFKPTPKAAAGGKR